MTEQILKLLDSVSVSDVTTSGILFLSMRIAESFTKKAWVTLKPYLSGLRLNISIHWEGKKNPDG